MKKAVVLDGYTLNPGDLSWGELESICDLKVYDRSLPSDIVKHIDDAEIVLTNKTPITKETLDQVPNVKYIGVLATGYNVVDIEAAKERGIIVTNIPQYSTKAVAQMVFAHILEICHHVSEHSRAVYKGQWEACEDFCYWNHPLIELADKTIGLIGFGSIGQTVANIAISFGMKVVVYNRTIKKEFENKDLQFVTLDELYQLADVISIHVPLTEDTKGMINKDSISQMKNGVIIVNTARGPIIVEEDLKEALNTGKVYAAGVDVVSSEPIKPSNPLLKAKNLFITPHIAWAPLEARKRLMTIATKNIEGFLNQDYVNVVNG